MFIHEKYAYFFTLIKYQERINYKEVDSPKDKMTIDQSQEVNKKMVGKVPPNFHKKSKSPNVKNVSN